MARRFRALDQIEAQEQIHLFGRYGLPRFNEHRTAREIHRFHLGSGFFLRARGFNSVGNIGRLQVSFVNRFAQRFEPDRIGRQRQTALDFGKNGRLIALRYARAEFLFQRGKHELLQGVDIRVARIQQNVT
ncbi:hypothetical protein SDC9_101245 [bioreactor metagenome]|uniref:Uncharacterized protein n=1 Tax=bioreactor metagenome TaxID=1076179 RepID=A0A645AN46_9ZZZZ